MDRNQKECRHDQLEFQNGTYYVICPACRMTWTAGSGTPDHEAGRVQSKHCGKYKSTEQAVAPDPVAVVAACRPLEHTAPPASTPIRVVSPATAGSAELPKG